MQSKRPVCRGGLLLGMAALLGMVAVSAAAVEPWEPVCTQGAMAPVIERVLPPVPLSGKWRGKGMGEKRKFDVDIENCGRTIEGLSGVSFVKGVVNKEVDLERDEDDGHYRGRFVWAEKGVAVVVTWDLQVETESRMRGHINIMGRPGEMNFELLEAKPNPALAGCECEAVRARRGALAGILLARQQAAAAVAREAAPAEWSTDPATCAIESVPRPLTLPTQESFEAVAAAGWRGEQVHRDRCCAVHRAAAGGDDGASTYAQWIDVAGDDYAGDEVAALTAEVEGLDSWLNERCSQVEE